MVYNDPKRPVTARPIDLPNPGPVPAEFVTTSVARRLFAWAEDTHAKRRISIISGPPGIGKSHALQEFQRRNPRDVTLMKIGQARASGSFCRRELGRALQQGVEYTRGYHVPAGPYELRNFIKNVICDRLGLSIRTASRGGYTVDDYGRLSAVVDEGQNCSREGIEALRYYNDGDDNFSPMPLGFIIVGNAEFSLKPGDDGETPISRAVADRALHIETFTYASVSDDDLALFADSRADLSADAMELIQRVYGAPRAIRSFRTLGDAIDEARERAEGRQVEASDLEQTFERLGRVGKLQSR